MNDEQFRFLIFAIFGIIVAIGIIRVILKLKKSKVSDNEFTSPLQVFPEATPLPDDENECSISSIEHMLETGDLENAVDICEYLLENDPENVDLMKIHANILYIHESGLLDDEVIAEYDRVLEKDPGYVGGYLCRGDLFSEAGDYVSAERDFDKAVYLAPSLPDAHMYRGQFYSSIEDFEQAQRDIDKSLALKDEELIRGSESRLEVGTIEILNEYFKTDLDDYYTQSYWERAGSFYERGDMERTMADLAKIRHFDPEAGGPEELLDLLKSQDGSAAEFDSRHFKS